MFPVPSTDPRVGALGRLAGGAYRRRGLVVVLWLVAVAASVGLSTAVSGEFRADYTARGSDSRAAQDLLAERFPEMSGEPMELVVRSTDGPVTDPAVRAEVTRLLADIDAAPSVRSAASPYGTPGAVSEDGSTLRATIRLEAANPDEMPVEDTKRIIALTEDAARPG